MAFRYIQLLTCNFLSPADWLARYLRDNKFLFSQKVAESITNKRDRCLIKIETKTRRLSWKCDLYVWNGAARFGHFLLFMEVAAKPLNLGGREKMEKASISRHGIGRDHLFDS